ncbi:hypothetical protein FRC08_004553 [Ceratobasidium sp. 394]|nr:hypothetical protein FRC08_004553 [Ceratobasidium sp. 394]
MSKTRSPTTDNRPKPNANALRKHSLPAQFGSMTDSFQVGDPGGATKTADKGDDKRLGKSLNGASGSRQPFTSLNINIHFARLGRVQTRVYRSPIARAGQNCAHHRRLSASRQTSIECNTARAHRHAELPCCREMHAAIVARRSSQPTSPSHHQHLQANHVCMVACNPTETQTRYRHELVSAPLARTQLEQTLDLDGDQVVCQVF